MSFPTYTISEVMKNQKSTKEVLQEFREQYPDEEYVMINGTVAKRVHMRTKEFLASIGAVPIEESAFYKIRNTHKTNVEV